MKRAHRRVHGILWPLLAPIAIVLVVLLARQRPADPFRPPTPTPATESAP